MNVDNQEVQKRALGLLQGGKDTFNEAKNKEGREKGYKDFVEGVELLINLSRYMKDNPQAVEIITRKIKEYMVEAKRMKELINAPVDNGGNNNSGPSGSNGNSNGSNKSEGTNEGEKKGTGDKDFVQGLELLINLSMCMKDNPQAVEIITRKIKEHMAEAKRM